MVFFVPDEKMVIRKHSAMIQTNVKELTLIQRKLINYLIFIVQKTGKSELYKTTILNIKKSCSIESTENVDLKVQLKKLADIKIEFNYMNKDKNEVWEYMSLLSLVKIVPNENEVIFEFPSTLRDRLLNPRLYAPINIILIAGLKSSYSVILYEFLRDYLTSPVVPILTIEQFRGLMGIRENEYKFFPNLKIRVIDPAIKEINEKTDIRCEYRLVKEHGNCYSHIQLAVTNQDFQLMLECNPVIKEEENKPTESKSQFPQEIIAAIPEQHRTSVIKELIMKHFDKGKDYIISNTQYTLKHASDNFSGYLSKSLENDYAGHDREVKTNIKVKTEKIVKHKSEAEKRIQDNRNKTEKKLEIMRQLPTKEQEKLRKRAITIIKAESPGNEFALSASLVEMKMADLYASDHELEGYSNNDLD